MNKVYNPFSNYQITIPKQFSESVKDFCRQSNSKSILDYVPFNRQVDFWYFSFLYAHKLGINPHKYPDNELTNITQASILDDFHIIHMQMLYLSNNLDIKNLEEYREIFRSTTELAHAGIPHVLKVLKQEDDKPLFNLLEEVEQL